MVKKFLFLSFAVGAVFFVSHDLYGAAAKKPTGAQEEEEQQQLTEQQALALGKVLEGTKLPSELLHLIGEYAEEGSYERYDTVLLAERGHYEHHVSFSPDERFMVVPAAGVYDIKSKKITSKTYRDGKIIRGSAQFSSNGQLVAEMVRRHRLYWIEVYDYKNGKIITALARKFPSQILQFWYSPDGSTLVFIDHQGSIFRLTSKNGVWDKSSTLFIENRKEVFGAAFSADGRYVALSEFNATANGSVITWYDMRALKTQPFTANVEKHRINLLSFSFDNTILALGSKRRSREIFLVDTSKKDSSLVSFVGDKEVRVSYLCFSPNELVLASVLENGTTKLWHKNEGTAVWETSDSELLEPNRDDQIGRYSKAVFSPRGTFLAIDLEDRVDIWRKKTLVEETFEVAELAPLREALQKGMSHKKRLDWLASQPGRYRQAAEELIKEGKLNAVQHRCATVQAVGILNHCNDEAVKKRLKKAYPEYCKNN